MFAIIAVAAAQSPDALAQVLRSDSTVNTDSFQYAYETSNGISAQEQGQLKQIGAEAGIATQGQFSYTSPEGQQILVSFVADENGFQPQVRKHMCILLTFNSMNVFNFLFSMIII